MDKTKIDMAIICIYNNSEMLNSILLKSIENQTVTCNVVLIDGNEKNNQQYGSAASIYNKAIKQTKESVIICVHQDISLEDKDILKKIYLYLDKNRKTIAGCAGAALNTNNRNHKIQRIVYGNIVEGEFGTIERLTHIDNITEVVSVDECLFAFNKEVFNFVRFDEETCNGWHFFASDLCYQAREYGINTVVMPLNIWHVSTGKVGNDFYIQMERIRKKYKKYTKYYLTTCITLNTNISAAFYKYLRNIKIYKNKFLTKVKKCFIYTKV